jgi:cytochrome c-type protein NapB
MKKTTIVISLFALIFSLCAFVGCQAESSKTETAGEERIASTPPLQPESHLGKFEEGGALQYYGCHGAGELANPMLTDSGAMPEDHYVGFDSSSQQIFPDRMQCISCHPVA